MVNQKTILLYNYCCINILHFNYLYNLFYTFILKILYLSYDGMTDTLGQSQVLPYLIGLSKLGHNITIVSAEKKDNFMKRQLLINQIVDESNIKWKPIFYTKNPPVISTILDVFKIKNISKELHVKENFDIVHCRSYITSLVGLHLKRNYKLKFLFDMRGFLV